MCACSPTPVPSPSTFPKNWLVFLPSIPHAIPSTASPPKKLAGFLARPPAVRVDLRESLSEEIVRLVADGSADIGILAGDVHTGQFDAWSFGRNQLVLALPAGH